MGDTIPSDISDTDLALFQNLANPKKVDFHKANGVFGSRPPILEGMDLDSPSALRVQVGGNVNNDNNNNIMGDSSTIPNILPRYQEGPQYPLFQEEQQPLR